MRNLKTNKGLWLLLVIFGFLYSFYAVVNHLRYGTYLFDLGVYDQIIWLASKFKPPDSSVLGYFAWGDHFTPTLLLLAPLYWLWDNVLSLLIFQAIFAVFGAWPMYLLAVRKLKDERLALLIALAYLAFFGLQNALAFDFHPIVLATTLLAWLFWLYEINQMKAFWLIFLLFLGLQENFFLLGAAFGLSLILSRRDYHRGGLIASGCFLGFGLLTLWVIPAFGHRPFLYWPVHLSNQSFSQTLQTLYLPPVKIQLVASSLLAFGFLPLGAPAVLLMWLEELTLRFLGTTSPARWGLGYQYNAILAPILAMATILTVEKFALHQKKLVGGLLIVGLVILQLTTNPSLNRLFSKDFYDFKQVDDRNRVLAAIPKEASVAAANNLGPHLTHREQIVFLTNCLEDPNVWDQDMKRCFAVKPEYLVADFSATNDANDYYPDGKMPLWRYFDAVQNSGQYVLVKQAGKVMLLRAASSN